MEKRKTSIDKLYFGIVAESFNYHGAGDERFRAHNLFEVGNVKWSVAYWVASDAKFKKEHDLISWCFSGVRGKCEYEFIVCPWPYKAGETVPEAGTKVDIYSMYVEPNAPILIELVNSVSVSSAKRFLAEGRKRWKR